MRGPAGELLAFTRAALFDPVPRDHQESDRAFRRRRVVAVITLIAGAVLLGVALRIPPGDPRFYLATFALAAVWTVGAFASGPLHVGFAHTRSGGVARPIVQSLALGAVLLALFLAGGAVVAHIPVLRDPVEDLLDHAREGSLVIVAVITLLNGIAEELYFRGALYAAVGRRYAVIATTVAYALITVGPGIVLLVLAAAALGLITGLQRRVTGGVLAPILTHITWSMGMLFLLPLVLSTGG